MKIFSFYMSFSIFNRHLIFIKNFNFENKMQDFVEIQCQFYTNLYSDIFLFLDYIRNLMYNHSLSTPNNMTGQKVQNFADMLTFYRDITTWACMIPGGRLTPFVITVVKIYMRCPSDIGDGCTILE